MFLQKCDVWEVELDPVSSSSFDGMYGLLPPPPPSGTYGLEVGIGVFTGVPPPPALEGGGVGEGVLPAGAGALLGGIPSSPCKQSLAY